MRVAYWSLSLAVFLIGCGTTPTATPTATAERQFWTVPDSAVSDDVYWKDIAFLTCEDLVPVIFDPGDFPLIAKLVKVYAPVEERIRIVSLATGDTTGELECEADAEWEPTALGEGGGEGRVIFYLKDYGNGERGHGFRRRCEDGALALPIVLNLCVEEPQQ